MAWMIALPKMLDLPVFLCMSEVKGMKINMKKFSLFVISTVILLSLTSCVQSVKNSQSEELKTSNISAAQSGGSEVANLMNIETGNTDISKEALRLSIVSEGNLARLAAVIKKAQAGEAITIGAIGGSITEGMSSSSAKTSYIYLVAKWWKTSFPQCTVSLVNAGIGSTGSLIGVHRMENDLLSKKPDLVVVEFAMNDKNETMVQETYEAVAYRILSQPNNPAVMLLFMTGQSGTNNQTSEIVTGEKLDLPMISYHNAVNYEIKKGTYKWTDLSADIVHPNDRGHKIAADLINHRLQAAKDNLDKIDTKIPALPPIENRFLDATLFNNKNLTVKSLGAFVPNDNCYSNASLAKGWIASETNKPIVFETDAQVLTILYKMMVSTKGALAEVRVDGELVKTLDSRFEGGFGEYAEMKTVLDRSEKKMSTVEIKLIKDDKDPTVNGTFVLLDILQS